MSGLKYYICLLSSAFVELFDQIIKRKLVVGVLAYLSAMIMVSNGLYLILCLAFSALIIMLIFCLGIVKKAYITEAVIFMLLFYCLGSLVMNFASKRVNRIADNDVIISKGTVVNREILEYSNRYTVKITTGYFLVYLYTEDGEPVRIGDKVSFNGRVEYFDMPRNNGEFDSLSYYESKNIRFKVYSESINVLHRSKLPIGETLRQVREKIASNMNKYMPENFGILKGIMLGDKSDIDELEKSLYQRGGISHILAISGLHVSNLSILIYFVLERLRLKKGLCTIVSIAILIVYAIFSGCSPSVIRAICMFAVSKAALIRGRNYDIPTALSISFFIYTLFFPYSYRSSGTILSYMAVFSIWLFSVNYKKIKKLKSAGISGKLFDEKILKVLKMSLFLTMFSLPMVLKFYYTFPIYSVALNMYVVPLMSMLFILAIFAIILSFINGFLAYSFFKLCSLIISSFTLLTDLTVNKLNGTIVAGEPTVAEIIFYYSILLIIILLINKVRRKYLLMSLLTVPLILLFIKPNFNSITMIDVDQGDCSVVTAENKVFMVDCGSLGKKQIFKYTVEPYLLSNGIRKIDYVFLSHSDLDHVNGIIEYLEAETKIIDIKNIVITPQMKEDELGVKIISLSNDNGIDVKVMKSSDRITYNAININCLHPNPDTKINDVNDTSMVLEIELDGVKALFTGDISSETEEKLYLGEVDILKVSHHGSSSATGEDFLGRIRPKIGLISCGRENSYGHPAPIVLDNLKKYNVNTYVTAQKGQIRIYVKDSSFSIKSCFFGEHII